MYICERCGKGLLVGMNVSHSHRRTKKRSLPNLHLTTVYIGGKKVTARYCTKCLRIVRAAYPYTQAKADKVEIKEVKETKQAPKAKAEKIVKEDEKIPQEAVATP